MKNRKHMWGLSLTGFLIGVISVLLIIWQTEINRPSDIAGSDMTGHFVILAMVFVILLNYYLLRAKSITGKWLMKILRVIASLFFIVVGGFVVINVILFFPFFLLWFEPIVRFFNSLSWDTFYIEETVVSALLLPLLITVTIRLLYPIQTGKIWFHFMILIIISVGLYIYYEKLWWLILALSMTAIGFIIGRLIDQSEQEKIGANTNANY